MLNLPEVRFLRNEATCLKLAGIGLLIYYCVMDIIMLSIFMDTDLVKSSKGTENSDAFHAFRHMSVKSLMCDHTTQYIIGPSAEYFDEFTHFSTVFSFITPNMISFFHLFIAAVCCRLISSESLQTRRLGVVLFEFRSWLDSLDGVVYRSHSNTKGIFQSARATMGYYVDIYCDLFGGVFLMFGVLFYLFKRFDPNRRSQLPWKNGETDAAANGWSATPLTYYSKKVLFWKCLCWGIAMAFAGKFWDNVIDDFKTIFQTPLEDSSLRAVQFEVTHSVTSVIFMWVWRLVEGQAALQYILLAIFLDKIWEFLNLVQYLATGVIVTLYVISVLYGRHLRALLHI